MKTSHSDLRTELGLRALINASGTMTTLGASMMVPEAIEAMAAIAPHFVEMEELHKKACAVVAKATGGEAGTITASTAAGIAHAIAGCMTGSDLGRIEQLPDCSDMKDEVVVQLGHMVDFGHPIDQDIRITGAKVRLVGHATETRIHQLEHALGTNTAAALYVVSHHTARFGMIDLKTFCEICHANDVPVIVDAASEYDLKKFLRDGADLVIYSGHKFLGGPTSGIVAGNKNLVRAAYLQNFGIGRPMKVGKESICGVMAAIEAWGHRDHEGIRAREQEILSLWYEGLREVPGLDVRMDPDPTRNPIQRVHVQLDSEVTRISAWELARRLAQGSTPVIVRGEYLGSGAFELDACNQKLGQPEVLLSRIHEELEKAREQNEMTDGSFSDERRRQTTQMLSWPD